MKIKKLKKNNIIVILISVLMFVFIVHNLLGFVFKKNIYIVNDICKINNEINTNAMTIKDEYIYLNGENVKPVENIKYPVGSDVITVPKELNTKMTTKYIDDMMNDLEVNHEDRTRQKYDISDLDLKKISNDIRNKRYDNKLLSEYNRKKNITEEEYFHKKKELSILKEVLNSKNSLIKTQVSGVVKNNIDNYEDFLKYNSSMLINDDFYVRNCEKDYNSPGLSIVDSMNLSLVFNVESSKLKRNLKAGDEIEIVFDKNIYTAIIREIKVNGSKLNIICDMDDGINILMNKRFVNIKLIDQKSKSYKIPKSSIIEKNGAQGVYIKKDTGITKFVAVKVLKSDDKFLYVSTGIDRYIDVNNRKLKTLRLYDNIITNPKFTKEGELLK